MTTQRNDTVFHANASIQRPEGEIGLSLSIYELLTAISTQASNHYGHGHWIMQKCSFSRVETENGVVFTCNAEFKQHITS